MKSQFVVSFLALLFCTWEKATSQDIHYARTVIDLLTSESMHGRGYVNNGHKITADYIASEFEHFGLRPFKADYLQTFPVNVNTFPGKLRLQIGQKRPIPGIDFLVEPSSPGIKGSFSTLVLDLDTLLSNTSQWVKLIKATDKAIVFNTSGVKDLREEDKLIVQQMTDVFKYNRDLRSPMYIEVSEEKLTWGTSDQLSPRAILQVSNVAVEGCRLDKIKVHVKNEYLDGSSSQNVIGLIEGQRTDSVIMVTAHYDHLGRLGKRTLFPGANDNASGVAMLLNLARHFSFSEKPVFSLLFIAFGGEELGLVGSRYYADRPSYPLNRVKFLLNLDIVGTGDEGITVVNGKVYEKEFSLLSQLNSKNNLLVDIKARGSSCNSDHCSFDQLGIPSFFIYTRGGIQAYHDINDRADTLPLTEFEDLFTLLVHFLKEVN